MGIKAFGTQLKRKDDTDSYEAIAGVTDISGPSLEADSIETTTHDSEDGFREFIQGLKDAGEVTLELRFDPAAETHKTILQDYIDGINKEFKLAFPDEGATEWTFTAHVTGFEPTAGFEDDLTASATFKLTGKPDLATV